MVANQIAKTRYMTDGQVSLPLVLRTANGGGPAVRRPAQPERRELGDGDPGPEGRRAVDAGRHDGPAGRRDPRPRPGDRLRAQGAVRDQGRGPRRRARRAARPGRGRPRGHRRARSSRWPRWCRAPSRPPSGSRPSTASTPRSSTCARSSRSTRQAILALGREDEPAVHGRGEPAARAAGAPRSCRSSPTRAFYSLDAPLVRITTPHIPLPSAAALEDLAMPTVDRIVETVKRRLDEAR